jgi:hypothetical protein
MAIARISTLILHLSLLCSAPALAAECSGQSGPQRVALLELYTSEGCSSCPPADRWLGKLSASGYSSDRVIPLALHVDYWDYIGWKDRFAKSGFSARQREMALLNHSAIVYTPQAMLNGHDYRGWTSASRFEADIVAINRTPARADIKLTLNRPAADTLEINAQATAAVQNNGLMYVALYENGLTSVVNAGENGGVTLHHDYVVREWLGPSPANQPFSRKLPLQPGWKAEKMGVAAFVQNPGSGEVLQALALKLCGT